MRRLLAGPAVLVVLALSLAFGSNTDVGASAPGASQSGNNAISGAETSGRQPGAVTGSGHDNVYSVRSDGVPETPNPGLTLFQQGCSTCHGLDGRGSDLAPSLIGVGAASVDFYVSTGRMPVAAPVVQAPRKQPAYSDGQRAEIVRYVASLGEGPPIPTVNADRGDLVEGNQLWANNCASCHNSAGSGGALGSGYYAPSIYPSTPVQVAEAIRVGPGAMPVFGPNQLSDQQVNSLVRYVEHLQEGEEPGGLSIGRLGPVPEGYVAIIAGLGAMLAIARWIGTRV